MSEYKLQAKKSLGQHFLHSPSAIKKIVEAAHLTSGETVLEIGPGTGLLTEELLKTGANITAVEKDTRAFELLKEKFAKEVVVHESGVQNHADGKLNLILGDILEMNPELSDGKYALVANIPYYITGAILRKFLENSPRPNRMVLLVQKEVANRMIGKPSGDSGQGKAPANKESLLSISVKAFGTPKIIAPVPRGAFVPPPTVDSAIIAIEDISADKFNRKNPVSAPKNVDIARFFDILHAGFAHKRKVLIRNLESILSQNKTMEIWERLGLDPKIRAEDVPTETWLAIAALCN